MKEINFKAERAEAVPCSNKQCHNWDNTFEQNCSGDIAGDPAPVTCDGYIPVKTSEDLPEIKKIEVNNGHLDIQMVDEKGILQNFINEIVKIFQKVGGINYCGWTVTHKKTGEQYELIIQNKNGKTPAELKEEAYKRLIEVEKHLEATLKQLEICHKMNPEEPCSVYETWFKAKQFLEAPNDNQHSL
jgi:DNA-directed RNA polymerase subunit L